MVRNMISILGWVLVGVAASIVGGDFAYSKIVDYRWKNWESRIERDAAGIRFGAHDYTLGEGKTALLFIHGFGSSPAIFQKMAGSLAKKGFNCRAMRLPGFGEPLSCYEKATRTMWRDAIHDEAEQLRKTHDQVWIVAHSLGATLAVRELIDEPALVDGLVFLAPLFSVSGERSPLLSARGWYEFTERTMYFTRTIESALTVDLHNSKAESIDARDRFVPRTIYDEMFALLDEVNPRRAQLQKPILVVVSRQDEVIDTAEAVRFFDEVASDHKEIMYVDQAGHVIPLDYGWEQVVETVADFVAK